MVVILAKMLERNFSDIIGPAVRQILTIQKKVYLTVIHMKDMSLFVSVLGY